MAHKNVYRLGSGEAAVPFEIVAFARRAFLYTAERLYPAMRTELEAIDVPAKVYRFEWLFDDDRAKIESWCRSWGLTDQQGRQAAPWACKVANDTLAHWRDDGERLWYISYGGAIPDTPAICDELGYRPQLETLAAAKRRFPRRSHASLSAAVKAIIPPKPEKSVRRRKPGAGGDAYERSPRKLPEHFEWLARLQTGRESYREIAKRYRPNHDDWNLGAFAEDIKDQVKDLKAIVGLSSAPGRPAR